MRERVTVSLDARTAERVRRCGATRRGGASAYVERLVRQDELREAVAAAGRWFEAHPDDAEHDEIEQATALAEIE